MDIFVCVYVLFNKSFDSSILTGKYMAIHCIIMSIFLPCLRTYNKELNIKVGQKYPTDLPGLPYGWNDITHDNTLKLIKHSTHEREALLFSLLTIKQRPRVNKWYPNQQSFSKYQNVTLGKSLRILFEEGTCAFVQRSWKMTGEEVNIN